MKIMLLTTLIASINVNAESYERPCRYGDLCPGTYYQVIGNRYCEGVYTTCDENGCNNSIHYKGDSIRESGYSNNVAGAGARVILLSSETSRTVSGEPTYFVRVTYNPSYLSARSIAAPVGSEGFIRESCVRKM